MTLEERLVHAIVAGDNETVLTLLKAGADPNHECSHPIIQRPYPTHVCEIGNHCRNYQAVLHLLDFGAFSDCEYRGAFRRTIEALFESQSDEEKHE